MKFVPFKEAVSEKLVYINVETITHYCENGNDGTREVTSIWLTSGVEVVVTGTAAMVRESISPKGSVKFSTASI